MTVAVFGASSQIGHFLLPRLRARGERVVAVSRQLRRDSSDDPGLAWRQGRLPDAVPTLDAPSAIVSFGPLLAFARWLATADLPPAVRIVATSSMSAQSKQTSTVPAERALAQTLREGEAALARACEQRGFLWTVFRPTLIYGAGLDKSLTPIARRAMHLRVFPLPAGRGLRQPVHADDIAQAVLAALDRPQSAGQVLPLGGGERLTAGEMFTRVRASLPAATLPLPLPDWLLRAGRIVPRLRGPLTRLDVDLIADNDAMQRHLDMTPRPFRPDAACWGKAC